MARRLSRHEDATLFSRFECKYLISHELVPPIRAFLSPFMRLDSFARRHGEHRYPVCSLYLDSDDLRLYQQTAGGDKQRFKLRLRTYDDRDPTVFLEVKWRLDGIVKKRRARLARSHAARLFESGINGWLESSRPDVVVDVEDFATRMTLSQAKPVVRVKYLREAYESNGGEPVRVTLDSELMHAVTLDSTLSHVDGRWARTPVGGTILEIKFTERYPEWIGDLVRAFDLKQQSVPKYVMSVDHVMTDGGGAALSLAGFFLPPRRAGSWNSFSMC